MVMEPPTPQCVGREFVRQYYTLLNQAPLHLHRFYNAQSSFVHGGIDSSAEAEEVRGQVNIHEKIVQLNFKDCHAKIRKVDSHKTLAEGVVVQVSGELSNNGEPMRRFVQTFVLAPQSPKKYYVHNDIFTYQDEVFTDGDSETNPHTTDEGRLEEPIQNQIIAAVKTAPSLIPEPVKPEPVTAVPETFNQVKEAPHMNGGGGYASPVVDQGSMEVEEADWKTGVESAGGWKDPQPQQQAVEAWKEEEVMVEDEDQEEEEEEEEEEEDAGRNLTPAHDSSSNEPMSWSSMVKMGAGAGKPPAGPAAAAQAAAPPKEGTPFSQQGNGQGKSYRGNRGASQVTQGRPSMGGQDTSPAGGVAPPPRPERFKEDEQPQGRIRMVSTNNDQFQLFVGNLPHNCTEGDLEDLFSLYGKVQEVRINKKPSRVTTGAGQKVPNFGFVVFEEMSSVEEAMRKQPILLYGNHRLNIEEKKTRTRESMGGGPGFNDRMPSSRGERGSSTEKSEEDPRYVDALVDFIEGEDPTGPQNNNQKKNNVNKNTNCPVIRAKQNLETKISELESELADTEATALQIMKESHSWLISLQDRLETAQDGIYKNEKLVNKLDAEIQELQQKMEQMEEEKKKILVQNESLQKEAEKLRRKRILQTARENVLTSRNSGGPGGTGVPAQTDPLIEFLTAQIKAKKADLECPVCLEISRTPIYMCNEQHIICANCWDKVISSRKECVQCRTPYPAEPRRHRWMEKVAEELQELLSKRREILKRKN